MRKSKVILVGAINEGNTPTCGETMKNQLFIKRFNELFDKVITVDTLNWKKHPMVFIRLLLVLLFNRKAKVVISASLISADILIKFLYYIRLKKDVYYWVVGGSLHSMIESGKINGIKHMKYLKAVIVQGRSMVTALNKLGLTNAVYTPNSKIINSLPEKDYGNHDKLHFVFLSRIDQSKGCDYIFESVAELNKTFAKQYDVTFYGKVSEKYDTFREKVDFFDNIYYKGVLNLLENTGYKELAKYDVMLFPTFWHGEGFPGVAIDAYIASLPVIATNWNLNTDVIKDREDGWIIPVHDVAALTNAMRDAIEHREDVIRMSNNCRLKAMSYDSRTVLSRNVMENLGLL